MTVSCMSPTICSIVSTSPLCSKANVCFVAEPRKWILSVEAHEDKGNALGFSQRVSHVCSAFRQTALPEPSRLFIIHQMFGVDKRIKGLHLQSSSCSFLFSEASRDGLCFCG